MGAIGSGTGCGHPVQGVGAAREGKVHPAIHQVLCRGRAGSLGQACPRPRPQGAGWPCAFLVTHPLGGFCLNTTSFPQTTRDRGPLSLEEPRGHPGFHSPCPLAGHYIGMSTAHPGSGGGFAAPAVSPALGKSQSLPSCPLRPLSRLLGCQGPLPEQTSEFAPPGQASTIRAQAPASGVPWHWALPLSSCVPSRQGPSLAETGAPRQGRHPPQAPRPAGVSEAGWARIGAQRVNLSPPGGPGVALRGRLPPFPPVPPSSGGPWGASASEERPLLADRRGMSSGGSRHVTRRRSSSSPSRGSNFQPQPWEQRRAALAPPGSAGPSRARQGKAGGAARGACLQLPGSQGVFWGLG